MTAEILELELALQDGATAFIKDGRICIEIDTSITKRDLWDTQIEMWLSKKGDKKTLSSGYLRVVKNKLQFKKWQ
jgi:hypothetical protein